MTDSLSSFNGQNPRHILHRKNPSEYIHLPIMISRTRTSLSSTSGASVRMCLSSWCCCLCRQLRLFHLRLAMPQVLARRRTCRRTCRQTIFTTALDNFNDIIVAASSWNNDTRHGNGRRVVCQVHTGCFFLSQILHPLSRAVCGRKSMCKQFIAE